MSADHGHAAPAADHGHEAPAADHGHGGGHEAPAADHGHGGGHEAPAADHGHGGGHAESHGHAGNELQAMRDKLDAQRAAIEGKINDKVGKVHGFLRFGKAGAPEKHNILVEPVYAAGDMLDATAGTAGRRIWEVAETTGAAIGATLKMAVNPILHPLNTLKSPLKYMANFGRIFTTSIENYANIFNAIPRSIQELYERGIQRPVQRTVARVVPVIGKGIEKLTNGLGWIAEQPRRLTEWLSQPIYAMDDWMMHAQAA